MNKRMNKRMKKIMKKRMKKKTMERQNLKALTILCIRTTTHLKKSMRIWRTESASVKNFSNMDRAQWKIAGRKKKHNQAPRKPTPKETSPSYFQRAIGYVPQVVTGLVTAHRVYNQASELMNAISPQKPKQTMNNTEANTPN